MATTYSQFTIYSSNDYGAPTLNGQTGSLLSVLNACLVTGYGNQAPAGWLKPFADLSSSAGPVTMGAFTQPSGSGLSFFVNDNAFNRSSIGTEASIFGWEICTNASASYGTVWTGSYLIGGGYGQFPSQTNVGSSFACAYYGRLIWRKSATGDTTPRPWIVMADAYTVYVFVQTGDATGFTNSWYVGMFGDIYSFAGTFDKYRCLIMGGISDAGTNGGSYGSNNSFDVVQSTNFGGSFVSNLTTPCSGMFMPRNWNGGGYSVQVAKTCDIGKLSGYNNTVITIQGVLAYPNGPDQSIWVSPIIIGDPTNQMMRGKIRGVYQVCHPIGNFMDGQVITGANEYAGKTFRIFKPGFNGGFWAMEISPTVDTNI